MTYAAVELDIIRWAEARKIIPRAKPYTQLLKAISEMGELADAELKGDKESIEDAIGDVMVCLVVYSALKDLSIVDCMNVAYDTIKHRKGYLTEDGTFVKQ